MRIHITTTSAGTKFFYKYIFVDHEANNTKTPNKTKRHALIYEPINQIDFVEGDMNEDLSSIVKGLSFDVLRTTYGADLVQIIGFYSGSCGTG